MKILLLGEYSGVHTNLATALRKHGYDVRLIHNGDGYKSFKADDFIKYKYFETDNKFLSLITKLYYMFLMYTGVKGLFQILKYRNLIKELKGYDIVQLINPIFISEYGVAVNYILFRYLKNNNSKIFLQALGDDYYWIKYCLDNKFDYSIFDRLSFKTLHRYLYSLHYLYGFMMPTYNKYITRKCNAIIPGLYDYYKAYENFKNCTEIVPIIVYPDKSFLKQSFEFPFKIFHGWQPRGELRKGNDILDKALLKLKDKYPDKISYKVIGGLTYQEYINQYNDADIFIDQCFSQDCGVNALLGMSKGKVVLSGFEEAVKSYYKLEYYPVINALPNVESIYLSIENLLFNTSLMKSYSENSIKFIEQYHSEDYVLSKYEDIWNKY